MSGTNVAFIAIDDLFAYAQFRDSFGVRIETPNLDALMAQSVNFENAYASVAICAPSRAATMSGKTAFETGVHDNFTGLFDVVDPADTWPAMIRDNGYFATSAGKVFHSKGGTAGVQEVFSEPVTITKSTLTAERTLTDGGKKWAYGGPDSDFNDYDVAQFGIDFLNRAPTDQPFLLTLGFDHPHTAYFNPERFFDLYPVDEIQIPSDWINGDLSDTPAFAQQFMSQPRGQEPHSNIDLWKANVQGYLASITHMDEEVGRFMDALAKSEHAADTAIVVYSDHGYQLGAKDHPVKFTLWEESAKAPLMIYHPDHAGGKTVSTPVSLMDIMPTMLEMTGTAIPGGLNGQSLLSFVTGDGDNYVEKPALTMMYGSFAIRSGEFRYIRYQDGSEELYDVVKDPGQITNLAIDPAFADTAARLRNDLLDAAREAGAVIDETVDVLIGTAGNDNGVASVQNSQIELGDGDDNYHVFSNATEIVETASGGYDSVWYMGTEAYVIPLNVERFFATQPDNRIGTVSAIGNEQGNTFYTGYTSGNFRGEGGDDIFNGGGWVEHTFYGGSGDDRLYGAKFADLLYGGDDDDFIDGNNKPDQIYGGNGHDTLLGNRDNDSVFGGEGNDRVQGGDGHDLLHGGAGDDNIAGGAGIDRIDGGAGDDTILTGDGTDSANGGAGNDTLTSEAGGDLLIGGSGNDVYVIGPGAGARMIDERSSTEVDEIRFTALASSEATIQRIGDALLVQDATGRAVWIEGAASNGDDRVQFSDKATTINALLAQATVLAEAPVGMGADTIVGNGNSEAFFGVLGDDLIQAKTGEDELYGGNGNDTLEAGNGDDIAYGGAGNDRVVGGKGHDTLDGGAGDDHVLGGADADYYTYRMGDGVDIVEDAGFSNGDFLQLIDIASSDVVQAQDGNDLALGFSDGGSIRIVDHFREKGHIEEILFVDGPAPKPTTPVPFPPEPASPGPLVSSDIEGTDGNDKLIGTGADETLRDGAGKDNLFGNGGADTFVLSADGDADAIKDFDLTQDRIDLSAWGVTSFDDLAFTNHVSGKTILRYQSEVLSINDGTWTISRGDFDASHFIFADASSTTITGTSGDEKLIGSGLDETLIDGAGKDNLFGRGGADVFILVADGDADGIKDFEDGVDRIDISAWGATDFNQLKIATHSSGKTSLSYGNERLSINDGSWTLGAESFSADDFIFA